MRFTYFLFIILALAAACCSGQASKSDDQSLVERTIVSPQEAVKLMENGALTIIDVRTDAEVRAGKIPGAQHADILQNDVFENAIKDLDPNQPILVYCKVGGRSKKAADVLEAQEFTQIYDLRGGMDAWISQDYPITK